MHFPRSSAADDGAELAMSSEELAIFAQFAAQDPAVESPHFAGFGLDANSLDGQSSAFEGAHVGFAIRATHLSPSRRSFSRRPIVDICVSAYWLRHLRHSFVAFC